MNVSTFYHPVVDRVLFQFEEDYDLESMVDVARIHRPKLLATVPAYIIVIFALKHYMKDRPKIDLRKPLVIWNIAFAVFSTIGFLRTFPECVYSLYEYGFEYSVCNPSFLVSKVSGFWSAAFCWSKLVEFGDTVFVVLQKKKLIFLHWYHHAMVVTTCVVFSIDMPALVRWCIWINYAVHSLMYSYYALAALKLKPSKYHAMCITALQITQMIVVVTVTCYAYHFVSNGSECKLNMDFVIINGAMYFSLFVLFFNYFLQTYLKDGKATNRVVGVNGEQKKVN